MSKTVKFWPKRRNIAKSGHTTYMGHTLVQDSTWKVMSIIRKDGIVKSCKICPPLISMSGALKSRHFISENVAKNDNRRFFTTYVKKQLIKGHCL